MKTLPLVLLAAAAAGVAYVVIRRTSSAPPAVKTDPVSTTLTGIKNVWDSFQARTPTGEPLESGGLPHGTTATELDDERSLFTPMPEAPAKTSDAAIAGIAPFSNFALR